MSDLETLRSQLQQAGQSHLVEAIERSETLRAAVASVDWAAVPDLIARYVRARPAPPSGDLSPVECVCADPTMASGGVSLVDEGALRGRGEAMLREGRVAVFTVAGGQGTRLGWNGPKGTFPASPVTGKPLFRLFAEQILAAEARWGKRVRWYIMTSAANDAQTRGFFLDNRCFGLDRRQIMMFPQGMMPAFDAASGRVLQDSESTLAMSPDGHGGSYAALRKSGALDQMEGRGAEAISYHQVDNPLVNVLDPVFIGLHADETFSSGEFTSKMVRKSGPDEKVGVFARRDGRVGVVEYSDMTPQQCGQTDEAGQLCYAAGNLAMHMLSTAFVRRVASSGDAMLPWHRAEKKVPYWDAATETRVEPEAPNGIKLERFVFDAMAHAAKPAILEVRREREFAPIKNASGVDSAASSAQLQSDLYGGWLEQAGVTIPRREDGHVDAAIEVSPLTAMSADDLHGCTLPTKIAPGSSFAC